MGREKERKKTWARVGLQRRILISHQTRTRPVQGSIFFPLFQLKVPPRLGEPPICPGHMHLHTLHTYATPLYLFTIRVSSSSAHTSVDGMVEKGYDSLPSLPQPLAGRQKLPTRPKRVGRLQLLLDEPIHRLDKRPLRFTPWRSCKCSRQNSSAQWMSLIRTPQLSMSCAVRPAWP